MKKTICIKSLAVVLLLVTFLSVAPINSFALNTIENGASYLINFKSTSMGVNVQFAPKSGIGNICLDSTNNKENNEIWLFTYNSKYSAWYITPKYRPDAALNALYGAGCTKGSQAKLHPSNINDTASLWKLEKDGNYYRFKNVACNYYLDVAHGGTNAGTRLNLWPKDNSSNQLFTLKKVASSNTSSLSSSNTIENNASYLVNFKNTSMGVNVQFAPKSGIGNICLDSTNNKENNEIWIFTYNSKYDAWYITPKYRPDAALNALYGASCTKGSQAKLHPSNINDTASLWKLEKDGNYYRFKNVACNYYLDVANGGTAAGTRLNLWSKDTSGNQLFSLTKISSGANFVWPVGGNGGYDQKNWPQYNTSKGYHSGTDISAPAGTPVYAAYSGTVVKVESLTNSYGKHIIIECNVNGKKVYMYYCHLSAFNVTKGEYVSAGSTIGAVGSTGNSSGPHLHFEVRNENRDYGSLSAPPLNPYDYLPKR